MHEVGAGIAQSVQLLRWQLDCRCFWVQFQAGSGDFYPIYSIHTGLGARSTSYKIDDWDHFLSLKRQLRKLAPLSSADVKNAWSNTSTPPVGFRVTLELLCTAQGFSNVVIRRPLNIIYKFNRSRANLYRLRKSEFCTLLRILTNLYGGSKKPNSIEVSLKQKYGKHIPV
jgi:hypothetical protein